MATGEIRVLILGAGVAGRGRGGEVFVLDMGQPIRIFDLARELITFSGYRPEIDIPIVFTGLRPGERRHERLWGEEEQLVPTPHPRIQEVKSLKAPRADLTPLIHDLEAAADSCDRERVLALLRNAVPEWQPVPAAVGAPARGGSDEPGVKRGGR